jgi:hypothetical protein
MAVELINNLILEAKRGNLSGNYGISETNALRLGLQYTPGIQHGRVLKIGSETPWVEACVLEAGAKERFPRFASKNKLFISSTAIQAHHQFS